MDRLRGGWNVTRKRSSETLRLVGSRNGSNVAGKKRRRWTPVFVTDSKLILKRIQSIPAPGIPVGLTEFFLADHQFTESGRWRGAWC